ncbi:MAG TPA: NHL repeat-containing protein [Anaerolineaceae bacterium]|nr:NHL repeat-containing protein [Anaerolineaceae bacterium]HPN52141.1 NHL repeat-containing protein [Anaerolineaceae bacterium]
MRTHFRSVIRFFPALICLSLVLWANGCLQHPVLATSKAATTIHIRRDTAKGLPYGGAHSAGVSTIVWGTTNAGHDLTLMLTRLNGEVVTRTATVDGAGSFSVSMDRLMAAGDTLMVDDGDTRIIPIPPLTAEVDAVSRIITGQAPANITAAAFGAPHSLSITLGGRTVAVTTDASGAYTADFSASPYLAGLLGSLRYTTPDGDVIFQPLQAAAPPAQGVLGDWRADVILGQTDFGQITPNEVTADHLFNPGGVIVDRSVIPNRVYVSDGGNNRVLGFSHLGVCQAGGNAGGNCTSNSDCPDSTCQVADNHPADLVLGQPSFTTSACNGDSSYQHYPDTPPASADTLCSMREEQVSILEGGSYKTMALDASGNLYLPDVFNNRVLRYNNPFTSDTTADAVWGQADFSGFTCNRGRGYASFTDANSLCLGPVTGTGDDKVGVALDAQGNLWVTDTSNNRVLRFPADPLSGIPAQTADLVLGQGNFHTTASGSGLNQMNKPASVRINAIGTVYVGDTMNQRILVFIPPYTNGMPAARALTGAFRNASGMELGLDGALWIADPETSKIYRFTNEVLDFTLDVGTFLAGGLGMDRDGNLLVAVSGYGQSGYRYQAGGYTTRDFFLKVDQTFNQVGPGNFTSYHGGIEVTDEQLIFADGHRLLFWNNPLSLHNGQPADGVVGQDDFVTNPRWGPEFRRMRAQPGGERLWVLQENQILAYNLPLQSQARAVQVLSPPLPLQGGGSFTWSAAVGMGGIDFEPGCPACIWLTDEENHRAFRIRNAATDPTVDIILGQVSVSGNQCNQGRGRDYPSRDSLCNPGALAFDREGNLFLSDHNLEFDGNWRMLEWDASLLPDDPATALFAIPASRVLGRGGDFTRAACLPQEQDPLCGPWEPAFDSQGRMVLGFNSYLGPRFPMIYQDPLTSPLPVAAIGDIHSQPVTMRFDRYNNLYLVDHNRGRILIYRNHPIYRLFMSLVTANP